jgi:hypothetical protein
LTLDVPHLSIDNGSGGSSTKMRSGLDFPIPAALSIDTVLIVNRDGSDTLAIERWQNAMHPDIFIGKEGNKSGRFNSLCMKCLRLRLARIHFLSRVALQRKERLMRFHVKFTDGIKGC